MIRSSSRLAPLIHISLVSNKLWPCNHMVNQHDTYFDHNIKTHTFIQMYIYITFEVMFFFIPQIISPTYKKHPQYCKLSVTTQQNKGPNKHLRLNPNLLMLFNIKICVAHNASEHRTSFTLQQAVHPSIPDVNGRQLCMDRITLYISMKWSLYYVTRFTIYVEYI